MRKEGRMPYPERERPDLDPSIKALLRPTETKEQIDAYFEHINESIAFGVCSECGQPVILDELYAEEHIKEYNISGLCKACQIKTFGI